jgi:hypothetical protein
LEKNPLVGGRGVRKSSQPLCLLSFHPFQSSFDKSGHGHAAGLMAGAELTA